MTKIVTVIGARPQFVKAATLSRAFIANGRVMEFIVHTGQHYDAAMSEIFFQELGIPRPAVQLNVGSGSHGQQTGRMLEQIESVLLSECPDVVLVYGDTNSTLAGAMAAAKLHIPVAHVEAGLRSGNRQMPEEINRIVTDHVSDFLFTPSRTSADNLLREGISEDKIFVVGDVMYDAVKLFRQTLGDNCNFLDNIGVAERNFVLVTIHRAENTDNELRMKSIVDALAALSQHIPVVFPLHPRTEAALKRLNLLPRLQQFIKIIPPVGYLDMLRLLSSASVVSSDSGGVQKEAFFFETPCVTLRTETEWVELVQSGWNRLIAPTCSSTITQAILDARGTWGEPVNPFGDGDASVKIASIIGNWLVEQRKVA